MKMIRGEKMFETQNSSAMTATNECTLLTINVRAKVCIKRKTNFYNTRKLRVLFRNVATS